MCKISVGNVALHVVQRGTGHPLLLVHGFPLDHQMWHGQLDGMSEFCRVIAPDLRGFGRSGITTGTVTMAQFADDLAVLLDALEIHEPVTLAGLSMGGYIAWQFWRRHRERLARLVLCDTRARADTAAEATARLELAERVLRSGSTAVVGGLLPKLFSEQSLTTRQGIVSATEQVMRSAHPEGIAAALRGMAQRPDATTWLSDIRIPTLVLCGSEDAISSPAEMEAIARGLGGSPFTVVPHCGHMAPLEDPRVTNEALQAFMGFRTATGS